MHHQDVCSFSFNIDVAKKGYQDFIATRPPARCPYDSRLFRSIINRHFESSDSLPQSSSQQQQRRQSSGSSCRSRRSQAPAERLSGGSGGLADVSNGSVSSSLHRRESSRSAMLVQRSLRELMRQQSLSQQQQQQSLASNPVSRRESSLSMAPLDSAPRSPCFTTQDELIEHLGGLLTDRCQQRQVPQVKTEDDAEEGVRFFIGSDRTSSAAAGDAAALANSAQAVADCLLGLPPMPQTELSLSDITEHQRIIKRSSELIIFAVQCLDQVQPADLGDDEKWTMSQLKVLGLLTALDQAGCADDIDSTDGEALLKWSFNQLRSHLFFPDGRVSSFLSERLASVWPSRQSGIGRLVRDIRLEMALPVSDDEDEDSDAPQDGEPLLNSLNASQHDIASGSGLLDATIEDANAEFPDLSAAPAIPAFYCGVEPPVLCDTGRDGGLGRSGLPRCGSASSTVLRGMTNQRQLFVPAATVAATSIVGAGRLASSASFAGAPGTPPSPGQQADKKKRKNNSSKRRSSRVRVLETPTPKRSRLRLQRLASERTRHCPIVIGESPPGSPSSPSPSASLLMLRAAAADKENQQPARARSCRAAALADAWVQRQRDREAELTRFDDQSVGGGLYEDDDLNSRGSQHSVASSSACRRISFQPDGGSSGSGLVRRASQLFANLVSP
ncbi:hypothetical protein BOX15_Mlig004097g1 [Macrostomum lignano]|uniref:Uncharacterized protein n=1 Tax=Macrostomum lignano TaxID=282301 RepID=A0A267FZM7_9PLAT|nr:hypothetical protein BOX15_Mlig004097g1 [Macrostomum lignano]